MEDLEAILAQHPFFEDLAPRYIKAIVDCATSANFEPGELILREGERAKCFYLICHGKVSLEIFQPGRSSVVVQTLEKGEILGWSWLMPPYQWSSDARAKVLTRTVVINGECLRGKCETDCELGYQMMKKFSQVVAQRLKNTRLQLLDVYGKA